MSGFIVLLFCTIIPASYNCAFANPPDDIISGESITLNCDIIKLPGIASTEIGEINVIEITFVFEEELTTDNTANEDNGINGGISKENLMRMFYLRNAEGEYKYLNSSSENVISIKEEAKIDSIRKSEEITLYHSDTIKIVSSEWNVSGDKLNLTLQISKIDKVTENENVTTFINVESSEVTESIIGNIKMLSFGLMAIILLLILILLAYFISKSRKLKSEEERFDKSDLRIKDIDISLKDIGISINNNCVKILDQNIKLFEAQSRNEPVNLTTEIANEKNTIMKLSVDELLSMYNKQLASVDKNGMDPITDLYKHRDLQNVGDKLSFTANYSSILLFEIENNYYLFPVLPKKNPSHYDKYYDKIDIQNRSNINFTKIVRIDKATVLQKIDPQTFVVKTKGILVCSDE